MRFYAETMWGHHGGGTNVHPGPAKPEPVYYISITENPLSLALLGGNQRNIEHFARRVGANGAVIPDLREICCRTQVSDLLVAHKSLIS
jgi:hypothetical protein